MPPTLVIVRYAVLAVVGAAAAAALAAMAVQRRMVSPFGGAARAIRRLTDPLLKPIERRLLGAGRNPQSAPWWLMGVAIAAGILLLSAARWLLGLSAAVGYAARSGPRMLAALAVDLTINLLMLALMVRVIGSWFGATRYTPWMRPFHVATEWMLGPIRRLLPPFGPMDLSPLVAWVLLMLLRPLILNML